MESETTAAGGCAIDLVRKRALFNRVTMRHRAEMAAGADALVVWGEPGEQRRFAAIFMPQTPCIDLELNRTTFGLQAFAPASVRVITPEGGCHFSGLAFVAGDRLLRMGWPSQLEMAQRRRTGRVAWPVRLRYRPCSFRGRPLPQVDRYADAVGVDFSGTGMAVSTGLSVPPGLVISLSFQDGPLAGMRPIPGLVRHTRKEGQQYRAGVELLADDPMIYRRLLNLHERLSELRGA